MEIVREVKVVAEVDTNKDSYEQAFYMDESESLDSFLLRVREWIEGAMS